MVHMFDNLSKEYVKHYKHYNAITVIINKYGFSCMVNFELRRYSVNKLMLSISKSERKLVHYT